jgi:hypothetical protein
MRAAKRERKFEEFKFIIILSIIKIYQPQPAERAEKAFKMEI